MTTPIDYSRPVGWWCAYCGNGTVGAFHTVMCPHPGVHVPRFLPIPEGQRPPAASGVEEAEIATSTGGAWVTWYGIGSKGRMVYRADCSWNYTLDTEHIERVTGATE